MVPIDKKYFFSINNSLTESPELPESFNIPRYSYLYKEEELPFAFEHCSLNKLCSTKSNRYSDYSIVFCRFNDFTYSIVLDINFFLPADLTQTD